ncbi:ATP-binding protein [Allosphingosinicella flava]|uniref:ATP-binding protein n=1 Tax=Allosphingosinicella flava TaxID=2771430 RepID=A0A7T2GJG4_9SPHN|nr:ATP-binding protein [Sphingosinicella flava]QPQ54979.1 ATP-binding protein [Sphingosinicella flava]
MQARQTERILPADLGAVAALADDVRAACRAAGVDEAIAIDLEIAVVEAANNIVVHGYGPGAPGHYSARIAASADAITITLVDRGAPIPAGAFDAGEVAIDSESGRGLAIIRACVDDLSYSSSAGENRLTLTRRF